MRSFWEQWLKISFWTSLGRRMKVSAGLARASLLSVDVIVVAMRVLSTGDERWHEQDGRVRRLGTGPQDGDANVMQV